jgi:pimeloyl-ACP methyl ester carboxylesterase
MTTYVLVPGMWLGGWAWDAVADELRRRGHEVRPVTLTGVGERRAEAGPGVDLDTHVDDVVRAVDDAAPGDVVLVGHSYGGLPVSAAALRIKDRIRTVVYVDSGPVPEGTSQLDLAGDEDRAGISGDAVAPRAWDPVADPVLLAGLDEAALTLLRTRSTPHPRASVEQPVRTRATSADLPTVLIACTFPMEQIREMMAAGHPFFAGLGEARIMTLPTGHWPMLSEPVALAAALQEAAAG